MEMLLRIVIVAPPLLVAVILHEIAHGLVAERLGDPTARSQRRINLNPLVHIDPFMTVFLPLALILSGSPVVFGGAKPVPVNPSYFRDPRRGMLWVAAAGPATNFILAAASYLALQLLRGAVPEDGMGFVIMLIEAWLFYSIAINLLLALFNLMPVPPLDGGRIAVGVLPLQLARRWAQLERFGLLLIIVLLYFGVFDFLFQPVADFLTKI